MSGDPYFENVSLLLHMDGSNGGTTFTDVIGNTITRSGNTNTSTTQKKFGTASGYFDGNGDYLSATAANCDVTSGAFTIEAWLYTTSLAANSGLFFLGSLTTNDNRIQIDYKTDGSVAFFLESVGSNTFVNAPAGSITTNTWYHIAAVRDAANECRLYLDGTSVGTPVTQSFSIGSRTTANIGTARNGGVQRYATGYIDDFRLTKGIARYTSNFTAPAAAFPDFPNPTTAIVRPCTVNPFSKTINRIHYQRL
jgi:hypothetical protein